LLVARDDFLIPAGCSLKTNSLLILACIAASLWAWQQDPAFAEKNLIFSLSNLERGSVWTLFAALFVHANLLHLFGNMLFLFVFGNTLEKTVGRGKLLTVFFTGGLLSFIVGLVFMPRGAGMLGASAAIFALAGCVMLVRPLKFSWLFLAPQGLIAIIYFIYNVIVVYEKSRIPGYDPQVAYVAHIIGFITGLPFGIALSDQWKKNLLITLLLLGIYLAIVTGAARALLH
jgi:membrane associated rhomboid family serine protease